VDETTKRKSMAHFLFMVSHNNTGFDCIYMAREYSIKI
jgi:hypothetical protein